MENKSNEHLSSEEMEMIIGKQKKENVMVIIFASLLLPLIALVIVFSIINGGLLEDYLLLIVLGVILLLLLIFHIITTFNKKLLRNRALKLFNRKNSHSDIINNYLSKNGLNITKTYRLAGNFKGKNIYLDDNSKRLAIQYKRSEITKVYNYNDLIGYEIFENGSSVVKGSAGKSLIGGMFFGLGGAITGSSGKRKINETVNTLDLYIRFNDIDNPQLVIKYIGFSVYNKNSYAYRELIEQLKKDCSILEYIINDKNNITEINLNESESASKDPHEKSLEFKLKELQSLFEKGLITEEEYKEKRKNLLDL